MTSSRAFTVKLEHISHTFLMNSEQVNVWLDLINNYHIRKFWKNAYQKHFGKSDRKVCQTTLFRWCKKFTLSLSFSKKELDGWDLFTEWVKELDWKFAAQDRKIALIVDNSLAHPLVDGLKAIALIFLPPNITSKTQSMDQGVIRSLKAFYRHSIIKCYNTSIDRGRSPTKVNVLEAMTWLTAAWECVSPITLVNCFRKAGINSESQARSKSDNDDPFKLLAAELEEFQGRCESLINFTVDGYVDADGDVVTSEAHLLTDS